MLSQFIDQKIAAARYKILDDATYFGEIPGMKGVWANAKTLEACRVELKEVLEDWIVLTLQSGEDVLGIKVKTDQRKLVEYA